VQLLNMDGQAHELCMVKLFHHCYRSLQIGYQQLL
jgi:hypothetical protein